MSGISLPAGFRFHPTDEELVAYYLKRKINGQNIDLDIIPEVDIYKCEPWDLPGKALLPSKDLEWYFFSPRDRKYPNGSRTNRATKNGYWKATGKDRNVNSQTRAIGMKKTLVYHMGRAPHGSRTDWIMHEYRLDESQCHESRYGLQDVYALCRVFKKGSNATKIEESQGNRSLSYAVAPPPSTSTISDHNWMHYPSLDQSFCSAFEEANRRTLVAQEILPVAQVSSQDRVMSLDGFSNDFSFLHQYDERFEDVDCFSGRFTEQLKDEEQSDDVTDSSDCYLHQILSRLSSQSSDSIASL